MEEIKTKISIDKFITIKIIKNINMQELFLWSKKFFLDHCPEAIHSEITKDVDPGDGSELGYEWDIWKVSHPISKRTLTFNMYVKSFNLSLTPAGYNRSFSSRRWYLAFNKKYASIITKFQHGFDANNLESFFDEEDLNLVIDYLKGKDS